MNTNKNYLTHSLHFPELHYLEFGQTLTWYSRKRWEKSVKHHERWKMVKSGTLCDKIYIVSDMASLVRYDLNLTLKCLRFYHLPSVRPYNLNGRL